MRSSQERSTARLVWLLPALLLCGVTTTVGFMAFVPTDYRGVSDLGLLASGGILALLFQTALTMTVADDIVPDHFHAYRELLVTDNLQVLEGGMLVDATRVVGQDEDGNDILAFIPQPSPASVGGARASSDFFDRFNDPGDQVHFNILSQAEQRLIAEWLDGGAQYYNNPFDAPQD